MRRRPKDLRQGYLIQAFVGHAYFSHYLHRMKRAPDAECMYTSNTCGTRLNTQFLIVYILRSTPDIALKAFVGNRNIISRDVRNFQWAPPMSRLVKITDYRLPSDVPFGPSSMTWLRTYYATKTRREDS